MTRKGWLQNLVVFSLGPACAVRKIQWAHVSAISTQHSTRPSDAPCASERSPWNCITHVCPAARIAVFENSCPNHQRPPVRSLKLRFSSPGLLPQVFPRSCVHGAVTRWRCHPQISPTHSFVLSRPTPRLVSCRVRLQLLFVDNEHFVPHPCTCQQCTPRSSFASWKRPFSTVPRHCDAVDCRARNTLCLAVLCQMCQSMFPHATQRSFHSSHT